MCHHCKSNKCSKSSQKINCDLEVGRNLKVKGKISKGTYDYIIVGDGMTGAILARKLSDANQCHRPSVLVLERGKNNTQKDGNRSAPVYDVNTFGSVNPELGEDLPWALRTNVLFNTSSTGQPRTGLYAEGIGFGGGGQHYYMNGFRGSPTVWDYYDFQSGGSGKWSYDTLLPFMKSFETYTVTDAPFNAAQRGNSGPMSILQTTDYANVTGDPSLQLFANNPQVGIGFNPDLNAGPDSVIGYGFRQFLNTAPLVGGFGTERVWTHNTFLPMQGSGEPNPVIDEEGNGLNGRKLKILGNTLVDRVLFKGNKAVGVEYIPKADRFDLETRLAFDPAFPLGQALPLVNATLPVVPTDAAFPSSGRITVDQFYVVQYTGTTVVDGKITAFTGCSTPTTPDVPFDQEGLFVQNMSVTGGSGYIAECDCAERVTAYGKNIILCAGTFGDASILQRSGVGPASLLNSLNIPIIVANENVGRNMKPHIQFFSIVGPYENGDPLSLLSANQNGAVVSGQDLHGITEPGFVYPKQKNERLHLSYTLNFGNQLLYAGFLYKPKSTGFLEITSKNPFAKLNLDFGLYNDDLNNPPANGSDLNKMMTWVKVIEKVANDNGIAMANPPPAILADNVELAKYIRDNSGVQRHQTSTCKLGTSVLDGVVDSDLRVFGTKNLMCADLSVLPTGPDGNPAMVTWMVAVRALQSLNVPVFPLIN